MNCNDSNLRRRALAGAAGVALLAIAGTACAVDANKVIDLRAERLRMSGGGASTQVLVGATYVTKTAVQAGQTISLTCDWSAYLVGASYWKTNVKQTFQIVITRNDHTLATRSGVIAAGKQLGGKSTLEGPPLPGFQSGSSKSFGDHTGGSTEPVQWTASGPGEHRFGCTIPKTGFDEPALDNNLAYAIVDVQPVAFAPLPIKQKPATLPQITQSNPPSTAAQPPALRQAAPAGALPDLVSDSALTVGTRSTQWGAIVQVDAANARRRQGGRCEFPIRHTLRNAGVASAAASSRRWTNDHVPGQWSMGAPPLAPQAQVERVDTLPLAPGRNVLYLTLDAGHVLQESNAANNLKRIAVEVNGDCGAVQAAKKSAFNPSRW